MDPAALLLLVAGLLAPGPARAADVVGSVDRAAIPVGDVAVVSIDLVQAVGEAASIFEGVFDLIGMATVVDVTPLTPGVEADWSSAIQNIAIPEASGKSSLTSSNTGGTRLVAQYQVTGLSPGIFDVVFGAPSFAQTDTATPPFFEDIPIATLFGTLLARITVVPEPSSGVLFGVAALLLWRADGGSNPRRRARAD